MRPAARPCGPARLAPPEALADSTFVAHALLLLLELSLSPDTLRLADDAPLAKPITRLGPPRRRAADAKPPR